MADCQLDPDARRRQRAHLTVARTGTPEDIAAAASFFARQEASFISGQVLYVAGGPKA